MLVEISTTSWTQHALVWRSRTGVCLTLWQLSSLRLESIGDETNSFNNFLNTASTSGGVVSWCSQRWLWYQSKLPQTNRVVMWWVFRFSLHSFAQLYAYRVGTRWIRTTWLAHSRSVFASIISNIKLNFWRGSESVNEIGIAILQKRNENDEERWRRDEKCDNIFELQFHFNHRVNRKKYSSQSECVIWWKRWNMNRNLAQSNIIFWKDEETMGCERYSFKFMRMNNAPNRVVTFFSRFQLKVDRNYFIILTGLDHYTIFFLL